MTDRGERQKMSKTILTGFEISSGNFTNKSTGELVPYNNRILYFITDAGNSKFRVGFFPFSEKLKASELLDMLNLSDFRQLDDFLNKLIDSSVQLEYCPNKDGAMSVCDIRPLDVK